MAKVETVRMNIGMTEDTIQARQAKLKADGYLLVSQSGSVQFYESTDGIDKDAVIEQHNRYMALLQKS